MRNIVWNALALKLKTFLGRKYEKSVPSSKVAVKRIRKIPKCWRRAFLHFQSEQWSVKEITEIELL
mgnify:CR=1 FL=1